MVDRCYPREVKKKQQQKTKKLGLEIISKENMQISWNAFLVDECSFGYVKIIL